MNNAFCRWFSSQPYQPHPQSATAAAFQVKRTKKSFSLGDIAEPSELLSKLDRSDQEEKASPRLSQHRFLTRDGSLEEGKITDDDDGADSAELANIPEDVIQQLRTDYPHYMSEELIAEYIDHMEMVHGYPEPEDEETRKAQEQLAAENAEKLALQRALRISERPSFVLDKEQTIWGYAEFPEFHEDPLIRQVLSLDNASVRQLVAARKCFLSKHLKGDQHGPGLMEVQSMRFFFF